MLTLAVAATLAAQPVSGRAIDPSQPLPQARCDGGLARWSMRDFNLEAPITRVWSCRVGGRQLVVKWRLVSGPGLCSADPDGPISAWIDGVKVVRREMIGYRIACYYSGEPAIAWMSMDRDGRFVVCRDRSGEAYPIDGARRCTFSTPSGRARLPRDPAYRPPGARTAPRLALRIGSAKVCARLKDIPSGPTLRTWRDGVDSLGIDASEPVGRSARLDIDNDGRPDIVELRTDVRFLGKVGQLWWRPVGAPASGAWTPPPLPGWKPSWDNDLWNYGYGAIRVRGATYLQVRLLGPSYTEPDPEAAAAQLPEARWAVTRALMALKPDGSAVIVCGWGPRPRPELYL